MLVTSVLVYAGMLELKLTNRELKREQAWSRIHLVPLILAEQDRDAYRRNQAAIAREKEIMKDVEGWEVSSEALIGRVEADEIRSERAHTIPRDIRLLPLLFSSLFCSLMSRWRETRMHWI